LMVVGISFIFLAFLLEYAKGGIRTRDPRSFTAAGGLLGWLLLGRQVKGRLELVNLLNHGVRGFGDASEVYTFISLLGAGLVCLIWLGRVRPLRCSTRRTRRATAGW